MGAYANAFRVGRKRDVVTSRVYIGRHLILAALVFAAGAERGLAAERLENKVAVFEALDKVTARTQTFKVPLNETIKFGALKVTPRVCYSRPSTEQPKTTSFVEVDEIQLDGKEKRIFTGWMFAESPGLNAVEHPVFDVWLTQCDEPTRSVAVRTPGETPAGAGGEPSGDAGAAPAGEAEQPPEDAPRRRVRR